MTIEEYVAPASCQTQFCLNSCRLKNRNLRCTVVYDKEEQFELEGIDGLSQKDAEEMLIFLFQ